MDREVSQACQAQKDPPGKPPLVNCLNQAFPGKKKDTKDHSDPQKCQHSLKEVSTGPEISRLPVLVISTINKTMRPSKGTCETVEL